MKHLLLLSMWIPITLLSGADHLIETQNNVKDRIQYDIVKIRGALEDSNLTNKSDLLNQLTLLGEEANTIDYPEIEENFKATLPFDFTVHKNIYSLYSHILKSKIPQELFVWHTPKNGKLDLYEIPKDNLSSLKIKMMRNEYRYETLNITNASTIAKTITVGISNIPTNTEIKVLRGEFVDGRRIDSKFTAVWYQYSPGGTRNIGGTDALVELTMPYSFQVESGTTKQVTFLVKTDDTEAGEYNINITLNSGEALTKNVQLNLNVSALKLPKIDYALNMYDYISDKRSSVTDENQEALRKTYNSHYGNTPVIVLPRPLHKSFNEKGMFLGGYDFTALDNQLNLFPDAKNYFVYTGLESRNNFARFDFYGKAWSKAIGTWAKALSKHMIEHGKSPAQLIMDVQEEPRTLDLISVGLKYAKAVKRYAPEITTYATLYAKAAEGTEMGRELIDTLDIVNIARHHFYGNTSTKNRLTEEQRNFYRRIRERTNRNTSLWFYGTVLSTQESAENHLLHLTRDFYNNAEGSGYWSLTDNGGNPNGWNLYPRYRPTKAKTRYTPLFIDATSVNSSRQWEAVREGMQNNEYLIMLKNLVKKLEIEEYSFDTIQKEEINNLLTTVPLTAEQIEINRLKVLSLLESLHEEGNSPVYRLHVKNGHIDTIWNYENDTIAIKAIAPSINHLFEKWYITGEGSILDSNSKSTTFTMPNQSSSVTASFKYMGDIDSDGDGILNINDKDDDNDGIADILDPFPFDNTEMIDTDNDGIGNNSDLDDDNDNVNDIDEISAGTDPLNRNDYLGATRLLRISELHTFGVKLGESKKQVLTIYNDGNSPLTISELIYLHPSNKNSFSFQSWSGEIAPMSSKSIEITYTPTTEESQEASIYIRSDKTGGDFQQQLRGQGVENSQDIDTDGDGIIDIIDTDDDNDGFSDIAEIAAGTDPLDKNSYPSATRVLKIDNITPFGKVEVDETKVHTITLRNEGTATLTINRIYVHPSVKKFYKLRENWSGEIPAGGTKTLEIIFEPTQVQKMTSLIYFKSDKTSGNSEKLLQGEGISSNGIDSRILRIGTLNNFSEVSIGESKTETLTLYNDGNSPLSITNIYLHPSIVEFYSFEKIWNDDILAGESKEISITYTPTKEGVQQGLLYIRSNKTSGNTEKLLQGIGI